MSTPLQPKQWSLPNSGGGEGPHALGRIESINVEDIDFSQHEVDDEKVERMAAKKKAGAFMPLPIASKAGGRIRIQDGHHRALADMKNGKKRIQVRVF